MSGGKCETYRGTACAHYLINQTVYVRPGLSMASLEEKLAGVLTVVRTSRDVTPECLKFAFPSLCMFAFPPCDKTVHEHKPRMGKFFLDDLLYMDRYINDESIINETC